MCTKRLPKDKPVYCMGVGYAIDLVVCVAQGVDMFDCVYVPHCSWCWSHPRYISHVWVDNRYPTRTARFGVALVESGTMNLKNSTFKNDTRPIDETCECIACKVRQRPILSSHLLLLTSVFVIFRSRIIHAPLYGLCFSLKIQWDLRYTH